MEFVDKWVKWGVSRTGLELMSCNIFAKANWPWLFLLTSIFFLFQEIFLINLTDNRNCNANHFCKMFIVITFIITFWFWKYHSSRHRFDNFISEKISFQHQEILCFVLQHFSCNGFLQILLLENNFSLYIKH